MSKNFKVTLGTRDSQNVLTTEEVNVRAGAPYYDPPQVSFLFPSTVIPNEGTPTGPQWTTGEHWAFLPCRVVPTPNEDGTGRFFVQTYYSGVDWPNNPSSRFTQTFDGVATTLSEELLSGNITTIGINTGGGVGASGFVRASDVSGLRRAIIVTNADLTTSFNSNALGGTRMGFRNPAVNGDDVLAAYTHNLNDNDLLTLERMDLAYDSLGARKLWPSGSQVIAHPYHYVPLYQNEAAVSVSGTPSIIVIEEGRQFPLTGLFNVSGTIVSGIYSRLLNEIASGVGTIATIGTASASGMAVRFNGAGDWYIVSSVANGSGMVIYDYGNNPQVVSGSAEAVPYAFGSSWVTVGPGLVGCGDWDVVLSPDLTDGSAVPSLVVPFTATNVALVPGGAVSGTASYRWEVQPLNSGITTIISSGNSINVDFSAGIKIDVRVFVSGTGQPTCVHSDSTGYISLIQSINALSWYVYATFSYFNDGTYIHMRQQEQILPTTNNFNSSLYFHHKVFSYYPHQADLQSTFVVGNANLQVKTGDIDNWPSTGSFYIANTITASKKRIINCTYDGKSTSAAGHFLTGITANQAIEITDKNVITAIQNPFNSVISTTTPPWIYMPSIGNFPTTFISSVIDATRKKASISGPNPFTYRATNTITYNKAWLVQPGQVITPVTITNAVTPLLTFANALPNWVGNGTAVVMAPWNSVASSLAEYIAPSNQWNVGNTSLLILKPEGGSLAVSSAATFSIMIKDFTRKVAPGGISLLDTLWLTLPSRGKIVVPNIDKTQTLIFSYTGYDTVSLGSDGAYVATLRNCRVVQPNGANTVSSKTITGPIFCAQYREVAPDPTPSITHAGGPLPLRAIDSPGQVDYLLGFNIMLIDLILVNSSATSAIAGVEGVPAYTSLWEKQGIVNFPANGIVCDTPIYRDFPTTTTTPVPGGCLAGWTLVTIKLSDGTAKDIPISEIKIGDMIASMDRITYARKWCEVTDVRSLQTSEAFELITLNKKSIKVTGKHPIASCNERQWTPVEELEVGTWIETEDGPELLEKSTKDTQYLTVYDLTVDDLHTFIAGGILVHNKYKQNV